MAAELKNSHPEASPASDGYQDKEIQIDLTELFYRLLDKAWIIILVGVLGAVAAGLYTHFFVEETYMATTKLYVIGEDTAIDLTQLNFGDKLADDYVQVFRNRDVHNAVARTVREKYGFELPPFSVMTQHMAVSQVSNTRILSISYTCTDREQALQVLQVYANVAMEFIQAKMGAQEPPTVFEQPYASEDPTGPNLLRNVALGLAIGVLGAMLVLVFLFIIDDRIRTADQLERRLGLSTLGMMPIQKKESRSRRKGEKA